MKTTLTRGYPYPQCEPPLVADAADFPRDLYNLATTIDADYSRNVSGPIRHAVSDVPSADLRSTGTQTLTTAQEFTLDTFRSANVDDSVASQIGIISAGLYLIVGDASATTATASWMRLNINVNGRLARAQGIKPVIATGSAHLNVVYPTVLFDGDVVTLAQASPAASVTWATASLALCQLVAF